MAFDIGAAVATIKADISDFKKGIDTARNTMDEFSEKAKRSSQILAAGLTAAAGAAALFGKKAVDAFNEAEQVGQKLEKLTLNQTGATMENVDALKKQAVAMSKVGVYSKELVMQAQAQFTTFDLTSDTIQKLIPGFLDMMAAEKGVNVSMEDMKETANGFAKAMVGTTDVLVKQGFQFTDNQKEILKTGTQQQKLQVITEVLGKTYNGMNNAMRNTFQGSMVVAKTILGDFQQAIGELIAKAIGPLIQHFIKWNDKVDFVTLATNKLTAALGFLRENFSIIVGALVLALVPALQSALTAFLSFIGPLTPFLLVGAGIGLLLRELAKRFGGWGVMIDYVKDRLADFWNSEPVQRIRDFFRRLHGDVAEMGSDPNVQKTLDKLREFIPTLHEVEQALTKMLDAIHNARVRYEEWRDSIQGQTWLIAFRDAIDNVKNAAKDLWSNIVILAHQMGLNLPQNVNAAKVVLGAIAGIVLGITQAFAAAIRVVDGLVIVLTKFNKMRLESQQKLSQIPGGGILKALNPFLAEGGTARRGQSYIVGENGPELFMPGVTGSVVSNKDIISAMQTMTAPSSSNYSVTNNVNLGTDAAVRVFNELMTKKAVAAKFGVLNG